MAYEDINNGTPYSYGGSDKGYYMGTEHMVGNDYYEPQRTNNFEVQFTGFERLYYPKGGSMVQAFPSQSKLASKSITVSVDSYSAPQINISAIPIKYGNNTVKVAGTPEFPDSSITLNDYIGLDTENIITMWQKCTYNPDTEQVGLASCYKLDGYLIEYSPEGTVYRRWKIIGAFPLQVNLGDYSQDGNAVRKLTMTLSYDQIRRAADNNNKPGGSSNLFKHNQTNKAI